MVWSKDNALDLEEVEQSTMAPGSPVSVNPMLSEEAELAALNTSKKKEKSEKVKEVKG